MLRRDPDARFCNHGDRSLSRRHVLKPGLRVKPFGSDGPQNQYVGTKQRSDRGSRPRRHSQNYALKILTMNITDRVGENGESQAQFNLHR